MIFKKLSHLLFRKLKRKVKDSEKYKNESEYYYLTLDYFFHEREPKPKIRQTKKKPFSWAIKILPLGKGIIN